MQSGGAFTRLRWLPVPCLLLLAGLAHGTSGPGFTVREGVGPLERCDQLEITYDGRPVLRAEETVQIPAGAPLNVHVAHHGGIALREAPVRVHEITVCKAVPEGAGVDPSAVRPVVTGSSVEVSGPTRTEWVGYLIVRSPRGSEVALTAVNGPVRVDAFEGRLTVGTVNGPIALAQVRGRASARAENGPIKLQSDGGDISLRTQNGPIGVRLTGERWQSGRLEANAENGPLSLVVPARYRSGVAVESASFAPWSCRGQQGCGSIAERAGTRRAHFGDGPTQVRLSTAHGPVKVLSADAAAED